MSSTLQKFIDDTFELMTGLGEMKVAEAVFLNSIQDASDTPSINKDKTVFRKMISLAYQGQNIIKMCAHLPRDSNATTYARELWLVATEIDNLVSSLNSPASYSPPTGAEN